MKTALSRLTSVLLALVMLLSMSLPFGMAVEASTAAAPVSNDADEADPVSGGSEAPAGWGRSASYLGEEYSLGSNGLYQDGTLIESGEITWLILRGDALYWSQIVNEETDIFRKSLRQDNKTVYLHIYAPVDSFDVLGDDLYYLSCGEMVRTNVLTGQEVTQFVDRTYEGFWLDAQGNIQAIGPALRGEVTAPGDEDVSSSATLLGSVSDDAEDYSNGVFTYSDGQFEFYYDLNNADGLHRRNLLTGDDHIVLAHHVVTMLPYHGSIYLLVCNGAQSSIVKLDPIDCSYETIKSFDRFIAHMVRRGSSLYYADTDGIYGYDLQTEYNIQIISAENVNMIYLADNSTLYFCEESFPGNSVPKTYVFGFGMGEEAASLFASSYVPKTEAPSTTDPYYTSLNIFHKCGYGMAPNIGNCTCYAYGRSYENLGTQPRLCTGNAGLWYDYNKRNNIYDYGVLPALGAVAVWSNDRGAGHVAVVEKINGDIVTTSDSGWHSFYFKLFDRRISDPNFGQPSTYHFLGFIYVMGSGSAAAPTDSSITVSPNRYPVGQIKRGAFDLSGTITSKYALRHVTGTVYDVTLGRPALQYTSYANTTKYNIRGSGLDLNLRFQQLISGHTYYLQYEAADIYGYQCTPWKSANFTVYENAPQVSVTPTVSTVAAAKGQSVRITCSDPSALIHCRINGGAERTGRASIQADFTSAGCYNITAWTTRNGYSDSAEVYRTVNISQVAAPQISDPVFTARSAYVTISGSGTIYYTLDGSSPTEASSRYSGPVYLTSDCKLQAMAVERGKQNSNMSSKSARLSVPAAPGSPALLGAQSKIAVGKAVTVQWAAVPSATAYDVTLYNAQGNTVSCQADLSSTQAIFTLDEVGSYTIRVRAKNFLGSSVESPAVSVEAMAPVTVRVVDRVVRGNDVTDAVVADIQARIIAHDGADAPEIEGNVISEQTVDYGTPATRPSTPSKDGFTFAGYSAGWTTPVTKDTTIYADYEVNRYTVEFWNDFGDGTKTQLGGAQEVMYARAATPPQPDNIPSGYTLAGWSVDNSYSKCFDYSYVEGNMRLYTSYAWANNALPTKVSISHVARDEKCTSYLVDLTYVNTNLTDTQARLIVSLYSSTGRMVYTQTKDIDMDRLPMGSSLSDSIRLNYPHKASKATAVLVQMKNDLTGGAVSEMAVTTDIELPDSSGYWGAWTVWSTTAATGSDTRQVEKKVQYRYRDKTYTTSSNSSLSGWTRYNTTSTTGTWSGFSRTYVSAFTNDAQKREVESRYVSPTYKTQYHYYRFYGTTAPWTHWASSHPYCEEYWADSSLPQIKYSGGIAQYGDGYTGKAGNRYWLKCDGSTYGGADAVNRGLISTGSHTRQIQTGGGYTMYRYRDTYYTYHFWRWGNWSAWSDSRYSATSDRAVESRTLYRYRDYQLSYPGYDPSRDDSLEEAAIATYEVSGQISGLEQDYSGKKATILVYKKTNADPTQEQLEYVDQITLGNGNAYSFTVNPKEALDYQETGDFIVTLSIEGCDRLVNVDVIKAPRPTYTVTFYTGDDTVFAQQDVPAGGGVDLSQIPIPTKEGHHFVKWDRSVVDVTRNLEITAVFEKLSYPVIFVDHENESAEVLYIPYGDPIPTPLPNEVEGKTFSHWDGLPGEDSSVTGGMTLTAVWTPLTYSVEFRDFDGATVGQVQTVPYGGAATPPAQAEKDGVAYPWNVSGTTWWNVTQDMVIYPYIPYAYSVSAPTASVPTEDAKELFLLELLTDHEDETIYYTIDAELTEQDALSYVSELSTGGEEQGTVASLLEASANDVYTEADEEWSLSDFISQYNEPISMLAGHTVYAFAVDASGAISPVATFDYKFTLDNGVDPGSTQDSIQNVVFDRATKTVTADVTHANPVRVIATAYATSGKVLATRTTDLAVGVDAVSLRLDLPSLAEVDRIKVFLLDPVNASPLCPAAVKKI